MATLYYVSAHALNYHLKRIYDDDELTNGENIHTSNRGCLTEKVVVSCQDGSGALQDIDT